VLLWIPHHAWISIRAWQSLRDSLIKRWSKNQDQQKEALSKYSFGNLYSNISTVDLIDLSDNYLQGLDVHARNRTLLWRNCFLRLPDQRSLNDCKTFYALTALPFDGKKKSNRLKYVLAGIFGWLGVTSRPMSESPGHD
jgi:hypothetical protein